MIILVKRSGLSCCYRHISYLQGQRYAICNYYYCHRHCNTYYVIIIYVVMIKLYGINTVYCVRGSLNQREEGIMFCIHYTTFLNTPYRVVIARCIDVEVGR